MSQSTLLSSFLILTVSFLCSFDVSPPSLRPALERFSQFFVAPLFTPSCTERELKAVDSEHSKNLQSDMWRMYQLEKSLTKPGHPYGKFGTGNWNTLWEEVKKDGREPRDELLKWWNASYCAGRMKLVVLGKGEFETRLVAKEEEADSGLD